LAFRCCCCCYAANLIYTLVTHRDVFAGDTPRGAAEWSVGRALVVMVAGTGIIAVEAELASAALDNVAETIVVIEFPDDRN
jgi:Ca2+:H+ antiporter